MNELNRLINAFGYSFAGLRAVSSHPAFRWELIAACIMVPLAFMVSDSAVERALLITSIMLVLIVEILNTAVETVVDRISMERHELSGRAKDMGSAAVLLSLINAGLVWVVIFFK